MAMLPVFPHWSIAVPRSAFSLTMSAFSWVPFGNNKRFPYNWLAISRIPMREQSSWWQRLVNSLLFVWRLRGLETIRFQ